ncbi:IS5 family transposase [Actinoplanes aureus]|uniref:IS5 family transposase n=1 Tax=Actinoplanes aureus TaxID=2792083 RepID=A0A931G2R2_9ACTN|nr:IS5 family transposase [Actinoplanes aureus]MBG0566624.1 IS5 family transposase [Actinoplanes aureus]MBG0569353.1 IS5 family transposase [Actinoplanes aureus]
MSKAWVVDDELWKLIEPVLPAWPAKAPGPRPVSDRLCLQGILFVLHTGIGWEDLPQELGFGSGMTCWRRLQRWTEAGVFDQVHQILLAKLNAANRIDWSRAAMDASHIDAKKGGAGTAPSPVNRGKPGSKHHLICDGNGTPVYVLTSGANVPDIKRALDLLDCYPPIAGRPGRPRRRFAALLADKAYSSAAFRQACHERGTEPIIPKPKTHGVKGLGKLRYVVEQTFALLHQFRRLAVRWERRLDIHDGFVSLACVLICWRRLINWTR